MRGVAPRALVLAGLVGLAGLTLPAAATAQQAQLTFQATPASFTYGTPIQLQGAVAITQAPEWWCQPWPQFCVVLSVSASLQVTGSNGFAAVQQAWTTETSLQTLDPGPGQAMQSTTYTASGVVVVTFCSWDPFLGACATAPEDYVETAQTQVTVHPVAGPILSGVAPAVAPIGSVLALTGTQFTSTPGTVRINGTVASVTAWTPTAIGAVVPAGATSGPVTVTAGGQTSNGVAVAVQPALTALSPPGGPVGQAVTIQGTGFGSSQGGSTVRINGVTASVTQWSSTSVTATVPSGATSGFVVVTVGTHASNGLYFTVAPAGGSCPFSDNPLQSGTTVIKAVHLTELRTCIAGLRSQAGLSPPTWTDSTITAQQTAMKAVDVTELRTALAAVYAAWSLPAPAFTDTLTPGGTPIRAVHLQELRVALQTLQGLGGGGEGGGLGPPVLSYYHTDALGSVRLVTDANAQVIATRDYLPFGQDWQHTGVVDDRQFAQLERTPETGNATWLPLDYAGARYYHSQTARFISPDDPSYIDPLNPQTWNLYSYVMNNPLRWVDPSGTQAQCQLDPACFPVRIDQIDPSARRSPLRDGYEAIQTCSTRFRTSSGTSLQMRIFVGGTKCMPSRRPTNCWQSSPTWSVERFRLIRFDGIRAPNSPVHRARLGLTWPNPRDHLSCD